MLFYYFHLIATVALILNDIDHNSCFKVCLILFLCIFRKKFGNFHSFFIITILKLFSHYITKIKTTYAFFIFVFSSKMPKIYFSYKNNCNKVVKIQSCSYLVHRFENVDLFNK